MLRVGRREELEEANLMQMDHYERLVATCLEKVTTDGQVQIDKVCELVKDEVQRYILIQLIRKL